MTEHRCHRTIFFRTLWALPAAVALWLASPASGDCPEWDIDSLMQAMRDVRSGHARFTERKSIAILEEPLDSSGELFYTAPGRMEKRTLKPKPETMILDGETLVMERGKKKRRLRMQEAPELAAFIDSIRGTLAGDRAALERHYRLDLTGTADGWTLLLTPEDKRILAVLSHIRIAGNGNEVRSVETLQADGDSSLMLIERIAVR